MRKKNSKIDKVNNWLFDKPNEWENWQAGLIKNKK